MVIILAGNECTGKSTIFKSLQKLLHGDVSFIKESFTDSEEVKKIRVDYFKTLCKEKKMTVYDRATVLDDLVYSQVMDGKESKLIENFNLSEIFNQCIVLYFDCDIEELKERLRKRGDEYITEEQLQKISDTYKKIFDNFKINPIIVDTTSLAKEEVLKEVKNILEVIK